MLTCRSKLCVDPIGECNAPLDPYLDFDNWFISDRSVRKLLSANSSCESSSELSALGGCCFSSGGGNFFGNIGVSSVFSMELICLECLLACSASDVLGSEIEKVFNQNFHSNSFRRLSNHRLLHQRYRHPFSSAMPVEFVSPIHECRPLSIHTIRLAMPMPDDVHGTLFYVMLLYKSS